VGQVRFAGYEDARFTLSHCLDAHGRARHLLLASRKQKRAPRANCRTHANGGTSCFANYNAICFKRGAAARFARQEIVAFESSLALAAAEAMSPWAD